MAKNYVEETNMEEAGFKGDDTLYKRNENESRQGDGPISSMAGENVIQEKYGHRDEELPPQIGDEDPTLFSGDQQQTYDGNALNQDPQLGQRDRDAPMKNANESYRQRDGNSQMRDMRYRQDEEQRDSPGTTH